MEGIEYIYELCEALPRSGPGDNVYTRHAFASIPDAPPHPFILDIGCGQGMQTIELARISNGKIIALDNHQAFLDILMEQAKKTRGRKKYNPKKYVNVKIWISKRKPSILSGRKGLCILWDFKMD